MPESTQNLDMLLFTLSGVHILTMLKISYPFQLDLSMNRGRSLSVAAKTPNKKPSVK
jgi:hypothetical protein